MADTKISALTAATTLADSDELVLASAGASKKITGANLKASIPGTGGAGALTLLSTTTLGSAGTFDITSISGAYNDLVIVVIARDTTSGNLLSPQLLLNNDSGGNYYNERISCTAATATAAETLGGVNFGDSRLPGSTALANSFGVNVFTIYGYASTVWLKALNWESYGLSSLSSSGQHMQRGSGIWNSTSAVNRVSFKGNTGANLVIGSQLRIYGRL